MDDSLNQKLKSEN